MKAHSGSSSTAATAWRVAVTGGAAGGASAPSRASTTPEPPERDPTRPAEPDPTKPSPNNNNPDRGDRAAAASEMGLLCEKMSARDLRRFLTARLSDRDCLRAAGPDALRRAPDPAALVLRAVGCYYICAESRDAEAACVLLLELYVRAGCPRRRPGDAQREAQLREEVREAALSWRSRLVRVSGRVGAAGAREARGLTLFMAGFGVPLEFPPHEVYDLLAASGSLSCTKVLRCSKLFVKAMRDVVVEMLNKDLYLQAIRIILAFQFQNAFPLAPTLTHIMEKVDNSRRKEGEELPSHPDPIGEGLAMEAVGEAAGPECIVPGQQVPLRLMGLKKLNGSIISSARSSSSAPALHRCCLVLPFPRPSSWPAAAAPEGP